MRKNERARALKNLEEVQQNLLVLRTRVMGSGLSNTQISGYLRLIDKQLNELKSLRLQMNRITPQKIVQLKTIAQFVTKTNASLDRVIINFKKNKQMNSQISSPYSDLPIAPTQPLPLGTMTASTSVAKKAIDPFSATQKFVELDAQLRHSRASLRTLNSFSSSSTEQQVGRIGRVTALLEEHTRIQNTLNKLGLEMQSIKVPLTSKIIAEWEEKLKNLSDQTTLLDKSIGRAMVENMPKAPPTRSNDEPSSGPSMRKFVR